MLARSMEQIRKNERAKEEKARILNVERRKMFCEINMEELIHMVIDKERRVQCSFFKVPDPIRRVSEPSYDPRLISFGLYGRSDERWALMEKVKLEVASIVLKVLRDAIEDEKRNIYVNVSGEKAKIEAIWHHLCDKIVPVGHNESGQYIWKLYSDAPSDLSFPVVRHLLVLDAIFLSSFMLFQRAERKTRSFGLAGFEKYEPLRRVFTRAGILCNLNIIASDMWLFENQIPLVLIRKMVREMYIHEEDEERMSPEQKNAGAEQAFEILVKDSVQRMLRVLPGNYRRKPGQEADGTTTDKMLRSSHLRKYSHLLECLYRLVCSPEEKPTIDPAESLKPVPSFPEEKEPRDPFQPMLRVVSFVTNLMRGRKRKSEEEETVEKTTRTRGLIIPKAKPSKGPPKTHTDEEEEEGPELVRRHSMAQSPEDYGSESLRSRGSGVMFPRSPEQTTEAHPAGVRGDPSRWEGSESPQVEYVGVSPIQDHGESVQISEEIEGPMAIASGQMQRQEGEIMEEPSTSEQEPASLDDSHQPLMQSLEDERNPASSSKEDDQGPPGSIMRRVSTKRKRVSILEPATVIEMEPMTSGEPTGLEIARFIGNMPKYFDYNYKATRMYPPMWSGQQAQSAGARAAEAEQDYNCLNSKFLNKICASACQGTLKIDSYTLPTVTNLREVGIRVEGDSSAGFNCKVELQDSSLPWGNATLHISPLNVDGNTERLLRNLVAFEIVSTSGHRLLTYLQCLDDLINTQGDVCLLKEGRRPVILNSSLDERDVAKLFNRMLLNCTVYHNPQLQDIRHKVRLYYLQQWRRGWTEFKERYGVCSKPWVAISLLAGFLVLGMTAVQTVYTVISFYQGS